MYPYIIEGKISINLTGISLKFLIKQYLRINQLQKKRKALYVVPQLGKNDFGET